MSDTTLLTIPVDKEIHRNFHKMAKENETPVRSLGALVIEQAIEDYRNGELQIDRPSLKKKGGA